MSEIKHKTTYCFRHITQVPKNINESINMILTVLFVLRVYTNQRNYMSTISSQLETKSAPLILSLPQSSSLNSLINMKQNNG